MTSIDYFQIIFLVIIFIAGIGGFIWAVNKKED